MSQLKENCDIIRNGKQKCPLSRSLRMNMISDRNDTSCGD